MLEKVLIKHISNMCLSTSTSTMLRFDQVLEALSSTLEKVLKALLSTSTKMLDQSLGIAPDFYHAIVINTVCSIKNNAKHAYD